MSILSSLLTSADALQAFDRVLAVTQNNVANVATPGFVKQRAVLESRPFDLSLGSGGGVSAEGIRSSRDLYAEQSVRRQALLFGRDSQNAASFTALQSVFDISGQGGIPNALNDLFASFSAWAQSPGDANARQNVLDHAENLAVSFQQTAAHLNGVAQDSEQQIQHTVDQVNHLVGELQIYNVNALQSHQRDPALDAQIHAALEELSQYVDVTAVNQDDGSVTVLLNGQTALLVGSTQFPIGYRLEQPSNPPPVNANARPLARISGVDGADITKSIITGQLGALLDFRNRVLPSYFGDAYQPGDLNRMAQQFADRVNQLLTAGNISEGPPPVPGVALFTYDAGNPTGAAQTLALNPAITQNQLASFAPDPPVVSNGVPLALSNLSNPQSALDQIDGASYNEFYGNIAARAGRGLQDATTLQEIEQSTLAQAKNLREQTSSVSLDEEAAILVQFQRAYEANSRFLSVLDQLSGTVIDMMQP